jgi:ATP-binding cassette, subfamily B, bacterial
MTLKQLLSKNRKQLILYMIGAFITTINGIFFTFALSNAFGIIEETDATGVRNRIIMVALFAFTPIFTQILSRYLRMGFMRDILIQVRTLAYQKMMSFSYENYKKLPKETHLSMLVSDINLFEKDFFLSLLNIIYSFGTFLLGTLILWSISGPVAIATFVVTLLLYVITAIFKPIAQRNKAATQTANANYNIELTNILMGLEVIKLYHVEENFKRPFESIIEVLEQVKRKAFQIDEFQSNLNHWIASSYQMLIYVYATYLYIQNEINLSSLILVFNLIGQLIWSMINGFNLLNRYRTSVDIFNRITHITPDPDASHNMKFEQDLKVMSLSFSYQDKKVLDQLDFVIKPKEKILITGASGAGKTTLVSCLTQNLSSYQGHIEVDQVELKTIQHDSFLETAAYIRQQHFLFNDSIKNNIILNQNFDQAKLERVLKDVDLYDWVMSLVNTWDHELIQDGSNISGGQRQRLSIARELYHDHAVLFVDEPSASLDDVTSQHIYSTLLKLDKTLICVSHRHIDYLKQHFDKTIELQALRSRT